jgi:peptidoglycan/xylan/chitin deacetylase (PgdA/CDA1 family)
MSQIFFTILMCLIIGQNAVAAELPALAYHDIVAGAPTDDYAVSATLFREQMRYLKRNGYQPLSLRQLKAVAAGTAGLPEKPILLTFDDGLRSFQKIVLPILNEFRFPAVLSVVTGWVDGRDVPMNYRGQLLSWEELRALSHVPLVEILSHTDDLHHGIQANPQGNLAPAGVTRRFDAASHGYESEQVFRQRIHGDLARSVRRLRTEIGTVPQGVTWPYGYYDQVLAEEAKALGMVWQLTVAGEPARTDEFPRINRIVLYKARTLADFERLLVTRPFVPQRILQISLDDLSMASDSERERYLSSLLTRINLLRIDAVIVSPFSRDGKRAYFAGSTMVASGDFLGRLLHQIRTRAGIRRIWLRLPETLLAKDIYVELARRHEYDGILLPGNMAEQDAGALRALFEYYRPGMACGVEGSAMASGCTDFCVLPVMPDRVAELKLPDPPAAQPLYYVLENKQEYPFDRLIDDLRLLRHAGVARVGLQDDSRLANAQTLTRVAVELARMGTGRD